MNAKKIHILSKSKLMRYLEVLVLEEKSPHTLEKYERDIRKFYAFCGGKTLISKQDVIRYKADLFEQYELSSANSMLTALNQFFRHCGWEDMRVRLFKVQHRSFCDDAEEIKLEDYHQLLDMSRQEGDKKLNLILQTLCSTGIRVSELQYITVEALRQGRAEIWNKGKSRIILIPNELCQSLSRFACEQMIESGPVFVTRTGRPVDRSNIWRLMKLLSQRAQVDQSKVYPHNLRHLFARTFYGQQHDLACLADILGHCSVNTTRIYITASSDEQVKKMSDLGLVQE